MAFKHAEHKNSLLQKDYDRALALPEEPVESWGLGRR